MGFSGRRKIRWSVRAACATLVVAPRGMWQLVHSEGAAGWSADSFRWQDVHIDLISCGLFLTGPCGSWQVPHQSLPADARAHLLCASCSTWLTAITPWLSPP